MTSFNHVGWQSTSPATELPRLAATVAAVIPRQAVLAVVVATAITHSLEAVELGVDGARFTLDGKPTFLLGISYYGALGAPEEFIQHDLDDMQRHGFNWIRVWATWSFFDNDVSAVDVAGKPRQSFMTKLQWLVAECDRRGMVVDVTLARSNGTSGAGRLTTSVAHRRSVETLVTTLMPRRNWFIDLANERNVPDARFVDFDELKQLRDAVKRLDSGRLVTASDGDLDRDDLIAHLRKAEVDFISPHRHRSPGSPKETEGQSRKYSSLMKDLGTVVPVLYQEPFRRGYGPRDWEPAADAFATDLNGALSGGAAGWCFHNGDQKDKPGGRPRRCFDLRERRLFEQFDDVERSFLGSIPKITDLSAPDRVP